MNLKPLGNTGLMVTPMGLGLASLGRPGYINLDHGKDLNHTYEEQTMEDHSHKMLELAWERGIRYFDAARSYGKAEQFLGNWIKKNPEFKHHGVIGSKWGYTYTADWKIEAEKHEVKEHSIQVLNRQWQETRENLGDALNLYQIHSATLESGVLSNQEVLNRLWELKEKGIKIGLSLSGTTQAETLEAAYKIKNGSLWLFDTVQITYNLLEISTQDILTRVHDSGWGVIVKEGVANGRLTAKNKSPQWIEKFTYLRQQTEAYETTIDALALGYLLSRHFVDIVLSGATTLAQLQSNLQALQLDIPEKKWAEIVKQLVEHPVEYWQTRKSLNWN